MRSSATAQENAPPALSRLVKLAALSVQITRRTMMHTQATPASIDEVVSSMCRSYEAAVNANDSEAYAKLFSDDAIRMPPGSRPEHGRDQIRQGEQGDYDVAQWSIRSTPGDAIQITDDWIYAIAHVEGTKTAFADGAKSSFQATKTWLLQRQEAGEWLIARQMWNLKPRPK